MCQLAHPGDGRASRGNSAPCCGLPLALQAPGGSVTRKSRCGKAVLTLGFDGRNSTERGLGVAAHRVPAGTPCPAGRPPVLPTPPFQPGGREPGTRCTCRGRLWGLGACARPPARGAQKGSRRELSTELRPCKDTAMAGPPGPPSVTVFGAGLLQMSVAGLMAAQTDTQTLSS